LTHHLRRMMRPHSFRQRPVVLARMIDIVIRNLLLQVCLPLKY
jgi:hypothetical protein